MTIGTSFPIYEGSADGLLPSANTLELYTTVLPLSKVSSDLIPAAPTWLCFTMPTYYAYPQYSYHAYAYMCHRHIMPKAWDDLVKAYTESHHKFPLRVILQSDESQELSRS